MTLVLRSGRDKNSDLQADVKDDKHVENTRQRHDLPGTHPSLFAFAFDAPEAKSQTKVARTEEDPPCGVFSAERLGGCAQWGAFS